MGQLPEGAVILIETVADARAFTPTRPRRARLHHPDDAVGRRHARRSSTCCIERFPAMRRRRARTTFCYATTNRQEAVKRIAAELRPALIVVGCAQQRRTRNACVEVAERAGCPFAPCWYNAPAEIDWAALRRHRAASALPPAPRRRKLWSRRSSTPSRSASPCGIEVVTDAQRNGRLQAAAPAARTGGQ